MKKKFQYAILSAIALVGAVSFSSCSSGDEVVVDPNPTFDGQSVKTQFTISLPENIRTRMASNIVQESGFRGIDNIKLVPYNSDVDVSSTANDNLISLSAITGFDHANSNSKVYADVNLKVNTSNFLFYGKAVDNEAGTAISTVDDKFKFGTLSVSGLTGNPTLSSVTFSPVAIYTDTDADITAGQTVGTNLITALNAVADAAPTEDLSVGDNKKPKFKEVTSEQSATINNLWTNFKKIETGSSKNVELAFKELYMSLDGLVTTAAQTTAPNAYKMATAIRTELDKYVTATKSDGVTTAVELKNTTLTLTGYPASVNLPDGAARVAYDTDNKEFKAATNVNYASASTLNVASLDTYAYPANLQYFVNSPVKVADEIKSPSYGENTWADILSSLYAGTTNTKVTENTRSVAIKDPVQYGVARLDATVAGLSSTEGDVYKDYMGTVVDVTEGFELTGILVGGQKSVGWNFLPKSGNYTIYDKTLNTGPSVVKKGTASAINYTLVLQSTDNEAVNIALEFVNKCADFVGANGEIIPKGATFYLVGALKPSEGTKQDGAKDDVTKRVFTQDCKTIVTFTIDLGTANDGGGDDKPEKGLGTATKGLPDLRTPQMELGLSVDLQWSPGLTFGVTI